MTLNTRDIRNIFPMMNSKMGQRNVTSTTPETDRKQLLPTVVELQNLPGNEEADPEDYIFYSIRIICIGRREVCEYRKTDTDKLNLFIYF